jgi:hypothetical protein
MRPGANPNWTSLGIATCYELQIDLQPETGAYTGRARVTFTNLTGQSLPELVFRAYPQASLLYGGQLSITQASENAVQIEPKVFLADKTAVRLRLPAALAPGDTTQIELEFNGKAPADFGGSKTVYGIFNASPGEQVVTLANWYPILAQWQDGNWLASPVDGIGDAVVSSTALYRVRVTAPAGWQIITTGVPTNQRETADQVTEDFVSGPARDFMLVAGRDFVRQQVEIDGVQINHWGLPDGETRWAEVLQVAGNSIKLYDQDFGRYPFAELDIVAVPLQLASGVEYPGLILIGAAQYQPNPDQPFYLEIVVAHEAAHQWWYSVVGNDVLADPWQDEALATFSSLVYLETYDPPVYQGTLQYYQGRVEGLKNRAQDTDVSQPTRAFTQRPADYSSVVYLKGALFFQAIRQRLGDAVFFEALQTYYTHDRYAIASPEDLLGDFEDACDCNLQAIYAQWGVK